MLETAVNLRGEGSSEQVLCLRSDSRAEREGKGREGKESQMKWNEMRL